MDFYIRIVIVIVIVNSRMISCTFLLQQVLKQQVELIATEGVTLTFENDAILEIARIAAQMNKTVENIGARRLHTVIERIMEEISFNAAEEMKEGEEIIVTKALVQERLSDALVASDLSRFIL
jgi:ATP-dependent HslUV protease ATP-binding subunit HslU